MKQTITLFDKLTTRTEQIQIEVDVTVLISNGNRKIKKLYATQSSIYILKKQYIEYKILYKDMTKLYISVYSSDLLVVSQSHSLIIDSMEYRSSIIKIIQQNNNNVNVEYLYQTILDERLNSIKSQEKAQTHESCFNLVEEKKKYQKKQKIINKSYLLRHYKFNCLIAHNEFWDLYQIINSQNKKSSLKAYLKQKIQECPNLLKFLMTERKNAEMMRTSYCPELIKAFQTHSHLCLEYEYFSGLTLENIGNKSFTNNKLRQLISQIVIAIGQVHQSGLVYMDLSPGSITINYDGHILLTNIGMSSLVGKQFQIPVLNFCSPEALSKNTSQIEMDWWGLGALIMWLSTGSKLYFQLNQSQIKEQLKNQRQVDVKKMMGEKIDEGLINLTGELLKKRQNQRLGSKYDYHEVIGHEYFKGVKKSQIMMRKSQQILKPDNKMFFKKSNLAKNPMQNLSQPITLKQQALLDFVFTKEIEDD